MHASKQLSHLSIARQDADTCHAFLVDCLVVDAVSQSMMSTESRERQTATIDVATTSITSATTTTEAAHWRRLQRLDVPTNTSTMRDHDHTTQLSVNTTTSTTKPARKVSTVIIARCFLHLLLSFPAPHFILFYHYVL